MDHDPSGLQIRDVTIAFGGIRAIESLSFDVAPGEILSLIGPNGAGKTTLLNSVSGFVPAHGSICYRDTELLRQPAYRRASLGIGRTFQNLQLFGGMTLLENVLTGQHAALGGNILLDIARFPVRERERQARIRAMETLRLLGIEEYADWRARELPFGVQKLAGVARALAGTPSLLLLDEPAAGLNYREAAKFGELIVDLRQTLKLTILLVEHNMRLVMNISDRLVVLNEGKKLREGLPAEVAADPVVIAAYLGTSGGTPAVQEVRHDLADRA